jgi:hypothetical protein
MMIKEKLLFFDSWKKAYLMSAFGEINVPEISKLFSATVESLPFLLQI